MKNRILLLAIIISITAPALAQDAEGTFDHPMFTTRMTNYIRTESSTNFDAVDFSTTAGGNDIVTKEGTKTMVRYDFNTESGASKPSALQILRNYEAAAKKVSAVTVFLSADEGIGTFKIAKDGLEVWVKIETGGNENSDFYFLYVLEMAPMVQEITSTDILSALNKDGHMALYINFETGKADIKTESMVTIDQLVEMLKANPALKISIEGHTDNVGAAATNQTLSENRAKAVMNVIIAGGISATQLSSKGWGATKPIADNTTDDGKAKNRRVEIVKVN